MTITRKLTLVAAILAVAVLAFIVLNFIPVGTGPLLHEYDTTLLAPTR